MRRDWSILFAPVMIDALIEGRKTQTRRMAWTERAPRGDEPWHWGNNGEPSIRVPTMWQSAKRGDRVWVREAHWRFGSWRRAGVTRTGRPKWRFVPARTLPRGVRPVLFGDPPARYRCGAGTPRGRRGYWFRSPLHMPRSASRITLVLTNVRLQSLQAISERDALAEGVRRIGADWSADGSRFGTTARAGFAVLWNALHGQGSWDRNPEIVAMTFVVHLHNIDRMGDG